MKTFDEFLTEGKKSKEEKMRIKAFKQGGEESVTTVAVNPSIENPTTQTTVAVTPNPKKAAKVLLQNQVEEKVISYPMAKRHTVFNKGRKQILQPRTAMAKRSSSSSGGGNGD